MSDTTVDGRLDALSDGDLAVMHDRLDEQPPTDPAAIEAHHFVTMEMARRGMDHGHTTDPWAQAGLVVDEVQVDGPDDIDAPAGFEKAFQASLRDGGTVQVVLTVDGYVLKASPTVSDVHVDTIMGGSRRRRPAMDKAEWKEGDFATWDSSGGPARGQVEHIMREGVLGIPGSDFSIKAEEDDPAVLLRIFRRGPKGWAATETLVGHKMSTLRRLDPLKKEASYDVPRAVQSAAKTALKWIADGRAGDGFTSVGRSRASQLAAGGKVSRSTLVKMRAYFARHVVDKDAEGWGDTSDPTPGMVAWYAWGGDAGRAWANDALGSVEKRAIPAAITDLHLNVENRQHAIDEYAYGPMNPDEPGDYWQRLGDVWGVSAEEAATTRCHNCAAFNMTSEIQGAIADSIGDGGAAVVQAAELGYCELLAFKCAADRSCSVWLTGGPITDDSGEDDGEEAFLASLTDLDKDWYGQVGLILDAGGDPDVVMRKAGNPEALRDYWRAGGKGKVSWGAGGDFTSCVAAVGKYMTSEQAKGYCAIRHREVVGFWPGDKRNRPAKKARDVEALPPAPQVSVVYNFAPGQDGPWTPVVKHPGHPDQKVHGRKGGASAGGGDREGGQSAESYKGYELTTPRNDKAGSGGTRSPEASREAAALRDKAAAIEPGVTRMVIDRVSDHGGEMQGLEYRLKSEDSLARKIDADAVKEHDGDRAAAAAAVSDAVRYTAVFPSESYTAGVESTLKSLEDDGYAVRAKNFWQKGDPYQGMNVKATKDGVTVELQFHTQSSLKVKEEKLHPIYEEYRTATDNRKRRRAWDRMVRVASGIEDPSGYERLLRIGTLTMQQFETAQQAGLLG